MKRLLPSLILPLVFISFANPAFATTEATDAVETQVEKAPEQAPVSSLSAGKWETLSTADGFTTKRKSIEGSNIFAFRGEIEADVEIAKLLTVFLDSKTRSKWVNMYGGDANLESKTNSDRIYWIRFNTPFPTSDRDYVLHAVGHADHDKRVYTTTIESVDHPKKPDDGCCVRGYAYGTYYRFEAIPGTNKTRVEVEVHTDPKGWIPSWLTNMIQKNWPKKTLMSLIREASKPEVQAHPEFASWGQAFGAVQ